jgi:hypothetical protein
LCLERGGAAKPVGQDHAFTHGIAGDAIACDPIVDARDGVERQRVDCAGFLRAEQPEQGGAIEAEAAEHEAAVAARRTEADAFGLEHDDVAHAAFHEAERGGKACETAADDADVGRHVLARERRPRGPCNGSFVVARCETIEGG